jgi:hypothetical protein
MNNESDILIYVNDERAAAGLEGIRTALSTRAGVTGASVLPKVKRVIHVNYDPQTVDTQSLLATVRSQGVDARLVGL